MHFFNKGEFLQTLLANWADTLLSFTQNQQVPNIAPQCADLTEERGARVKHDGKKKVERVSAATHNATDAMASSIPVFAYEAPNFKRQRAGMIMAGKDTLFEIEDESEFGKALGYRGMKLENLTLDEFIWDRFTRDGAQRTQHCLQVQIAAYLFKHSTEFLRLYGDTYKELITESSFVCTDNIGAFCDRCAHL